MTRITLAALLKLELPGYTARIVDGGMLVADGETYLARDPIIGVPAGFDALNEGVGEEAPAGRITFNPPASTAASTLLNAGWQGARLRIWIAEVDTNGAVVGSPDQIADWILDQATMVLAEDNRQVEISFVGAGQRLFQMDRGNSLSPSFHKAVHPNETGLDNASGVATAVPWGAPSPPRGIVTNGSMGSLVGSAIRNMNLV